MCGITGFLDPRPADEPRLRETLMAMARSLVHRGPDGTNLWWDAAVGLGFGHTRLAIVDLSAAASQPMISANGRYVISYNGELYNAADLRDELGPARLNWRSRSDTEVLLEACATWGVEPALRRANGMFAFSLWDRQTRTLSLARDRLGIKPLYWGAFGGLFLFGSELKSLRMHDGWRPEIDRDALATYMRWGYVPAPLSIYRGVFKLEPGSILRIAPGGKPEISAYWDIAEVERAGRAARTSSNGASAIERMHELLNDAVRRQLVSDVPLGVFLSGGIDSSTVTALMQANSGRPIKSFSIGFRETGFDEAEAAKAVARHIGTDHTELYVEPAHALEVVPGLATHYDEPFGDPSQIPTYLLSEMTRQHVTVALSGDGGDEVFAGYDRYFLAQTVNRWIGRIPRTARRPLACAMRAVPAGVGNALGRYLMPRRGFSQPGDKLHRLAAMLLEGEDGVYREMLTHWRAPEELVLEGSDAKGPLWDADLPHRLPDALERMQYLDTITYLPDDILTKVDRASMAVSLEARVPLLDHRVVELAWQLPSQLKAKDGRGKWLLRQVLYKHVPRALVDRPKMGFAVPIGEWLRGPLRDWAEDLLDETRMRKDGILRTDVVRRSWDDHLGGRRNWQYQLWDVLMFQAWHRRWA